MVIHKYDMRRAANKKCERIVNKVKSEAMVDPKIGVMKNNSYLLYYTTRVKETMVKAIGARTMGNRGEYMGAERMVSKGQN